MAAPSGTSYPKHDYDADRRCKRCGCSRPVIERLALACGAPVPDIIGDRGQLLPDGAVLFGPEPSTTASPAIAEPAAGEVLDYDALMTLANGNLYNTNPFRVLGLIASAGTRDVRRQRNRLKMYRDFGGESPFRGPMPPATVPDEFATKRAADQLQDAEGRFLAEVFWFWDEPPDPAAPNGLQKLIDGDHEGAVAAWSARADDFRALHNLAVYHHASAMELEQGEHEPIGRLREACEGHWHAAFRAWNTLINRSEFWTALDERVEALDDPRLKATAVRRLRRLLPGALAASSAELAGGLLDKERIESAARIIRTTLAGCEPDATERAFHRTADRLLQALNRLSTQRVADIEKNPTEALTTARTMLQNAEPLLDALDVLLGSGDLVRDAAYDEFVGKVRTMIGSFEGADGSKWTSRDLLIALRRLSCSPGVVKELDESITVRTCWFCTARAGTDASALEVVMHGDVTAVGYTRFTVKVPRCPACWKAHQRGRLPEGVKKESHKTEYPTVRDKRSAGYKLGAAPPGM